MNGMPRRARKVKCRHAVYTTGRPIRTRKKKKKTWVSPLLYCNKTRAHAYESMHSTEHYDVLECPTLSSVPTVSSLCQLNARGINTDSNITAGAPAVRKLLRTALVVNAMDAQGIKSPGPDFVKAMECPLVSWSRCWVAGRFPLFVTFHNTLGPALLFPCLSCRERRTCPFTCSCTKAWKVGAIPLGFGFTGTR
jgi:hypothetical protein